MAQVLDVRGSQDPDYPTLEALPSRLRPVIIRLKDAHKVFQSCLLIFSYYLC